MRLQALKGTRPVEDAFREFRRDEEGAFDILASRRYVTQAEEDQL